jgi:hypothetical protein
MRALATLCREAAFVQGLGTDLPERISLASPEGLPFVGRGFEDGADRPGHRLERHRIQLPVDPPADTVPGLG